MTDDAGEQDDLVITPGESRPRDQVHLVRSTEAVRGVESGSYSIVTQTITQQRTFTMPDPLVLTPGGFRPSLLSATSNGGGLSTGLAIACDYSYRREVGCWRISALYRRARAGTPLMPQNVAHLPGFVPALGSGWIAYGSWTNNTGRPISLFRSTWTVPPETLTHSGKPSSCSTGSTISTTIYQPVLQGASAAGGGPYWSVASWYVDGAGGPGILTLVRVYLGDVLTGIMTLTGQTGSQFNCNCQFAGMPDTGLSSRTYRN